jgi:ribonuclease T1
MLRKFGRYIVIGLLLIGFVGVLQAINLVGGDHGAQAYRQDKYFQNKTKKIPIITVAELPPEGRATLKLIKCRGPFPYRKDGATFQNREKRLPLRPKGYYKEYTVKTPGRRDRGARRIVAGARGEFYYTSDHYRSFRLIRE